MKELNRQKSKTYRHRQQYVITEGTGCGEVEEGRGEIHGGGRRLDLGGEGSIQCTDDASQNRIPET